MCEIREVLIIAFSVLVLLKENYVLGGVFDQAIQVDDDFLHEMHQVYRDTIRRSLEASMRRVLRDPKEYNRHIQRLKEVNGFKRHNIPLPMPKGGLRAGNKPLFYINNPVESKIPNAYLTLESFKKLLTDRLNIALKSPKPKTNTIKRQRNKTKMKSTRRVPTKKPSPITYIMHFINKRRKTLAGEMSGSTFTTQRLSTSSYLTSENTIPVVKQLRVYKTTNKPEIGASNRTNPPKYVASQTLETNTSFDNNDTNTTHIATAKQPKTITTEKVTIYDSFATEMSSKEEKEKLNLRSRNTGTTKFDLTTKRNSIQEFRSNPKMNTTKPYGTENKSRPTQKSTTVKLPFTTIEKTTHNSLNNITNETLNPEEEAKLHQTPESYSTTTEETLKETHDNITTESFSKEENKEVHHRKHDSVTKQKNNTTTVDTIHDFPDNFTTEKDEEDKLSSVPTNVTSQEEETGSVVNQEEENKESTIIVVETTSPITTTTRSKRRTLGKPRVYVG